MKHLLLSSATLTALLATSCSSDDPIAVNPDPVGNAITFSPLVSRNTRATETTIQNLGDFGVFARSVDSEGALYDYYVIGSQKAPEMAKKSGSIDPDKNEGKWVLNRKVYWPEGVNRVLFWALTTRTENDGETGVLNGNGTLTFESTGPQIKDFTPIRAENRLTTDYSDGKLQQDLVGAFTAQEASTSQSNVMLNFNHELTQIQIRAKSNDASTDNRRVYIKGAWVVNVESKGTFNAGYKWDNGPVETPSWTSSTSSEVAYGALYDKNPKLLTAEAQDLLSIDAVSGSLMLVPQGITAWNQNGATGSVDWNSRPTYDDENAATTDAYILLYCRIELEHKGDTHQGDDGSENTDNKIFVENGNHYHQMFPVLGKDDSFDREKYGYTCVPIGGTKSEPFKWERGKRYIYTLSICGPNSGGGVYPPILPPDVPPTEPDPVVPPGKKPGDPVLSSEISFTVTVSQWEDNWKPGDNGGNIDLQ